MFGDSCEKANIRIEIDVYGALILILRSQGVCSRGGKEYLALHYRDS